MKGYGKNLVKRYDSGLKRIPIDTHRPRPLVMPKMPPKKSAKPAKRY